MIRYQQVTKCYGKLTAVHNISLEIERGAAFGLLGPNGAGKTTLIRMTTTLTPLTSGSIEIDRKSVKRNAADIKRKIGVVPQSSTLEREMSAQENLEYHGRLYGLNRALRRERIEALLDFASLNERKHDKANTFSGGMLRKLMIIKALMHEPPILLLDEPTTGLDASWRRKIWDLLRCLKQRGITILLTTHYLEEANLLCNRIGLIERGVLTRTGEPRDIISAAGNFVLEYFDKSETVQRFFTARDEAIRAAQTLQTDFKIREANLEDAVILLSRVNKN